MVSASSRLFKAGAVFAGGAVLVILFVTVYQGKSQQKPELGKRSFEFTYNLTVKHIPENAETIKAWVPVPAVSRSQQLHFIQVEGSWPWKTVTEPVDGNSYMLFDLSANSAGDDSQRQVSIVFGLTRFASRPLEYDSDPEKLSARQTRLYLSPTQLVPVDGPIAAEARRVAGTAEKQIDKAKMIFKNIVNTFRYDKRGSGWGRGDAQYAYDVRKGDSTDFTSLLIAELRSLEIPARFIMGFIFPENSSGKIDDYHCWAEFYIEGKGWLPADAAQASTNPSRHQQFFAALDENRVAFTVGRDIELPGSTLKPVNFSIYPTVEIDGKEHTKLETSFSFKDSEMSQKTISAILSKKIKINEKLK